MPERTSPAPGVRFSTCSLRGNSLIDRRHFKIGSYAKTAVSTCTNCRSYPFLHVISTLANDDASAVRNIIMEGSRASKSSSRSTVAKLTMLLLLIRQLSDWCLSKFLFSEIYFLRAKAPLILRN